MNEWTNEQTSERLNERDLVALVCLPFHTHTQKKKVFQLIQQQQQKNPCLFEQWNRTAIPLNTIQLN